MEECGGDLRRAQAPKEQEQKKRAATPFWGCLTGSGVAERRAVKDADIITVRYTDGGLAPANATARQHETCTRRDSWARADNGAGVRRLAAEFNGWRSRRKQWL